MTKTGTVTNTQRDAWTWTSRVAGNRVGGCLEGLANRIVIIRMMIVRMIMKMIIMIMIIIKLRVIAK